MTNLNDYFEEVNNAIQLISDERQVVMDAFKLSADYITGLFIDKLLWCPYCPVKEFCYECVKDKKEMPCKVETVFNDAVINEFVRRAETDELIGRLEYIKLEDEQGEGPQREDD